MSLAGTLLVVGDIDEFVTPGPDVEANPPVSAGLEVATEASPALDVLSGLLEDTSGVGSGSGITSGSSAEVVPLLTGTSSNFIAV